MPRKGSMPARAQMRTCTECGQRPAVDAVYTGMGPGGAEYIWPCRQCKDKAREKLHARLRAEGEKLQGESDA